MTPEVHSLNTYDEITCAHGLIKVRDERYFFVLSDSGLVVPARLRRELQKEKNPLAPTVRYHKRIRHFYKGVPQGWRES